LGLQLQLGRFTKMLLQVTLDNHASLWTAGFKACSFLLNCQRAKSVNLGKGLEMWLKSDCLQSGQKINTEKFRQTKCIIITHVV
jgi:hypothetical protein